MPTVNRRRRRASGAPPVDVNENEYNDAPDPEDSPEPPAAEPEGFDIFDYMAGLSEKERGDRMVYLYRKTPEIRALEGEPHYIEKIPPPIDEDYIAHKWGGGTYLVMLKHVRHRQRERAQVVRISGAPKIAAGTVVIDGKTGQPVENATPVAAQVTENVARDVVNALAPLIQQNQSKPVSADEFLATGMQAVRKSMEGAIDILTSSVKQQATPRDPMAELKTMLSTMRELQSLSGDDRKSNPMGELKEMLSTVREIQGITGENQTHRSGGLVEDARALVELLKVDTDGSIRSLLLGGRDPEEPASLGASIAGIAAKAIERRPDLIDSIATGLRNLVTRSAPAPGPPIIHAAPVLQGATATAAAAVEIPQAPSAPPVEPQKSREEIVLEGLLQAIVNGYRRGAAGDEVAMSIDVLYPAAIDQLAGYMNYPDELILGWLKTQPIIAPIVTEPGFPVFLAAFKKEILDPGEDEPEGTATGAGTREGVTTV